MLAARYVEANRSALPERRRGWLGRHALAIFVGLSLAAAALAAAGIYAYESTPPVYLQHPDPRAAGADALVQQVVAPLGGVTQPSVSARPAQARQGTWIEIPSLKVALPIHEGDGSNNIPDWQAMHYPGTAAPGRAGNSYLYAHGLWGMFGGLVYAHAGDTVLLHDYDTGTTRTFHVVNVVGRVAYNDRAWLRYTYAVPTLTLQTCVDFNPEGDRFIVIAQ